MNTLEIQQDVVMIGSTVAVRDLETNEFDIYTLVPPNKADIASNRISSLTPVAHALYGRRAGEIVAVTAPAGAIHLRMESVRPESKVGGYG